MLSHSGSAPVCESVMMLIPAGLKHVYTHMGRAATMEFTTASDKSLPMSQPLGEVYDDTWWEENRMNFRRKTESFIVEAPEAQGKMTAGGRVGDLAGPRRYAEAGQEVVSLKTLFQIADRRPSQSKRWGLHERALLVCSSAVY